MKKLIACLMALTMLFSMAACGSQPAASNETEKAQENVSSEAADENKESASETVDGPKTISVGIGTIDTLDSRNSVTADAYTICSMCGEGLFRNVNGVAVPAVVDTYEVNSSNTEYTFHLKQNVLWADGTPVTAKDFEFAVLSLLNPENACGASTVSQAYNLVGASDYLFGDGKAEDVGIKAVDEYTLTMNFATAVYEISLCDRTFLPIKQEVLEKAGESYGSAADTLLSNGPFKVDSWTEDKLTIVKNDQYWDAEHINMDAITYVFKANYETGVDMMLAGEMDLTYVATLNSRQTLVDAGMTPYDVYGGYEYLYINHQGGTEETAEWIKNKNFRQALSCALDREALVAAVFTADAPASRLIDPNERGVNGSFVEEYPYEGWSTTADVEKAKEYLSKACEELGKTEADIPEFSILATSGTTNANTVSAVSAMWSAIGVKAVFDSQDFNGYVDKGYSGQFDFMLLGTNKSDVDWFEAQGKYFVSPSTPLVYYESEEFDAIADKLQNAESWQARKDALFEMEKFATEEMLVLDMANIDIIYVANPAITNVYATTFLDLTYADIQ